MVSPGCTLTGTLTDTQGNTLQAVVTLVLCNYGAADAGEVGVLCYFCSAISDLDSPVEFGYTRNGCGVR
jgi:hypothetical protein